MANNITINGKTYNYLGNIRGPQGFRGYDSNKFIVVNSLSEAPQSGSDEFKIGNLMLDKSTDSIYVINDLNYNTIESGTIKGWQKIAEGLAKGKQGSNGTYPSDIAFYMCTDSTKDTYGLVYYYVGGQKQYNSNVIQFKIGEKIYESDKDMTWMQWLNSNYNTDGYGADRSHVYIVTRGNNINVVQLNSTDVSPNDIIIKDIIYSVRSGNIGELD